MSISDCAEKFLSYMTMREQRGLCNDLQKSYRETFIKLYTAHPTDRMLLGIAKSYLQTCNSERDDIHYRTIATVVENVKL